MQKSFSHYPWRHGHLAEFNTSFSSELVAWSDSFLDIRDTRYTYFGFVHHGVCQVLHQARMFILYPEMYFSIPGPFRIEGGHGILMARLGFKGLFTIGGPLEHEGRLKYIDGCTDTLLIPPVKKGDACLNLLYFPPGIDQTQHTHPSDRIGLIVSGRGQCVTPAGNIDLEPQMIFCIHENGLHSFRTPYGEHMRVLAFHPDSDFGPTDEDHPMLNRTIVDGVSASKREEIRTR